MEFQTFFDAGITLLGFLGGWILNSLTKSIDKLQIRDGELTKEVHDVHILVAGDYIKRTEFKDSIDGIFESLRRIEDMISAKADK